MSEERAIVVSEFDVRGTAIEAYGQRPLVRELMTRLLKLHPAAREVGEDGMLAVAQLAVLVGANPLPSTNEIHVWYNNKKGVVEIDLGINYFRRRANELGGVYWVEDPRIMSDKEYQQYGVDPKQQIGAICKAARVDKLRELQGLGLTFEQALSGLTRVGVGIVSRGARPKQGRPLSWTALKGAEKDVSRALFPNLEQPENGGEKLLEIVPHVEPSNGEWPGETVEAGGPAAVERLAEMEAQHREDQKDWEAMTPEEQQAKFEENCQLMQGDEEFEGFDTPAEPPPAEEWDGVIGMTAQEYLDEEPEPPPEEEEAKPTAASIKAMFDEAIAEDEAYQQEKAERAKEEKPKQEPKISKPPRPWIASQVRSWLRWQSGWKCGEKRDYSDAHRLMEGEPITEGQVGGLNGLLGAAVKRDGMSTKEKDKARHTILKYVFDVDSATKLTKAEATEMISHFKLEGSPDDRWKINRHAESEAAAILAAVGTEQGQMEIPW